MSSSGRVVGIILLAAGAIIGIGGVAWLLVGREEGETGGSALILGILLLLMILVIPLMGFGAFLVIRGAAEARETARVGEQRRLLDMVKTRGQVNISDLVLESGSTRDRVQSDIYELVGRGLFTGYVDWNAGRLMSVDARNLQGQSNCPNCGGQVQLAGKRLIKCPYCGAEIFL